MVSFSPRRNLTLWSRRSSERKKPVQFICTGAICFLSFSKNKPPPGKDTPRRERLDLAGPQSGDAVAPGGKWKSADAIKETSHGHHGGHLLLHRRSKVSAQPYHRLRSVHRRHDVGTGAGVHPELLGHPRYFGSGEHEPASQQHIAVPDHQPCDEDGGLQKGGKAQPGDLSDRKSVV